MRLSTRWIAALALLAVPALAGSAAATDEMKAEAPMTMNEKSMMAHAGHVARATFTSMMSDREPQGEVTSLTNEHNSIMFFTELLDLDGHEVTHVWEHDGAVMARVAFLVKGPRWRVHSSKNLEPSWVGEWTVKVMDEHGKMLHSQTFSYTSVTDAQTAMPASMRIQ